MTMNVGWKPQWKFKYRISQSIWPGSHRILSLKLNITRNTLRYIAIFQRKPSDVTSVDFSKIHVCSRQIYDRWHITTLAKFAMQLQRSNTILLWISLLKCHQCHMYWLLYWNCDTHITKWRCLKFTTCKTYVKQHCILYKGYRQIAPSYKSNTF